MQVLSLASLSELRIWCCRELWYRPATVALIRPLAWEPPNAMGGALKRKKKKSEFPSLPKINIGDSSDMELQMR